MPVQNRYQRPLPDNGNASTAQPAVVGPPVQSPYSTQPVPMPSYPAPQPVPPVPQPGNGGGQGGLPLPKGTPPPAQEQRSFRDIVREEMAGYRKGKNKSKGARKAARVQAMNAAVQALGGENYTPTDRQKKRIDRAKKGAPSTDMSGQNYGKRMRSKQDRKKKRNTPIDERKK